MIVNSASVVSKPQDNVRLFRSGVRPTTVRFVLLGKVPIMAPDKTNFGFEDRTLVGLRPMSLFAAVRKSQSVISSDSFLVMRQKNVRLAELFAN